MILKTNRMILKILSILEKDKHTAEEITSIIKKSPWYWLEYMSRMGFVRKLWSEVGTVDIYHTLYNGGLKLSWQITDYGKKKLAFLRG